jgi:hypothetical protein
LADFPSFNLSTQEPLHRLDGIVGEGDEAVEEEEEVEISCNFVGRPLAARTAGSRGAITNCGFQEVLPR